MDYFNGIWEFTRTIYNGDNTEIIFYLKDGFIFFNKESSDTLTHREIGVIKNIISGEESQIKQNSKYKF